MTNNKEGKLVAKREGHEGIDHLVSLYPLALF